MYFYRENKCFLLKVYVIIDQSFFFVILQGQANLKDKDVPKPTTDLSEDLFKVHDFDVKIDLQVPNAGKMIIFLQCIVLLVQYGCIFYFAVVQRWLN